MAKQNSTVLGLLAWITGVVVSLAVGFGLVEGVLMLPTWLGGSSAAGMWISMAVGWVVIITTLISAVLAILKK